MKTAIKSYKANPKRHWARSAKYSDGSKNWSVNTESVCVEEESNTKAFCYVWPVRGGMGDYE